MSKIKIDLAEFIDTIWSKGQDVEYQMGKALQRKDREIEVLETSLQEQRKSIELLQKQNDAQRKTIERLTQTTETLR